ncbi:MAG: DNA-protecting protein DprA [Flavobacterium sp.]|nr:DNA-protecting protein DprA [Flavobacterium sp.]
MRHTDLLYLLALQKTANIGDILAKKLIQSCGSAEEVFKSKSAHLASIDGVGSARIKKLHDKASMRMAEAELKFIVDHNIDAFSFQDENYPDRLKHCVDGPLLLFSKGKINTNNGRMISIVGTREITPHGTDFCRKLIEDLAPLNPVIVSGFAYGVDIAAHQAALDYGLQTIAVVAHGLNQIYPKPHKRYMKDMLESGGFITEFWSTSEPEKENFVKRNRIVAGMSEATIVVESAEKSGSLITARMASDYNRDVFAVPGRTSDKFSIGCNNLIKSQRAHLLTSAADLIYILNWELPKRDPKPVQKQLFVSLEPDEQIVYDHLTGNGKQLLDVIALECGFPIFKISATLLNMELKGVIRPLPGKMFEAI